MMGGGGIVNIRDRYAAIECVSDVYEGRGPLRMRCGVVGPDSSFFRCRWLMQRQRLFRSSVQSAHVGRRKFAGLRRPARPSVSNTVDSHRELSPCPPTARPLCYAQACPLATALLVSRAFGPSPKCRGLGCRAARDLAARWIYQGLGVHTAE